MIEEGGIRWLMEHVVKANWSESDEVMLETLEGMGAPETVLSTLRTKPTITITLDLEQALDALKAFYRYDDPELQAMIEGEWHKVTGTFPPEPWEWNDD